MVASLVHDSITAIHARKEDGRPPKKKHLPFVSKGKNRTNYWQIVSTGDRDVDRLIGRYYAVEALQFIKETDKHWLLSRIARDMPRDKNCDVQTGFWLLVDWYMYRGLLKVCTL